MAWQGSSLFSFQRDIEWVNFHDGQTCRERRTVSIKLKDNKWNVEYNGGFATDKR